jgi:hypothetical protein
LCLTGSSKVSRWRTHSIWPATPIRGPLASTTARAGDGHDQEGANKEKGASKEEAGEEARLTGVELKPGQQTDARAPIV